MITIEDVDDLGTPSTIPSGHSVAQSREAEEDVQMGENPIPNNNVDVEVSNTRRRTSEVWVHFDLLEKKTADGLIVKTGTCNYCRIAIYNADSRFGTSNFKRHLKSCRDYKKLNLTHSGIGKEIDQQLYRELLAEAIMKHGYSFSWVEHEGNRKIHKYLNDNVQAISRHTAKRVCLNMYDNFKQKIKNVLKELPGKICLTSDLWSATNKRGFLCITAHYVDKDWVLQSKLLCFRRSPPPHGGFELSQQVTNVIVDWQIKDKVFSLTLDNASNMDKMIDYLKQNTFKDLMCMGDHFHIRCCAHILNLIVKKGLEVINDSIHKIREGVRYIDGSDGRIEKFSECAKNLNLGVSYRLWMDVPTRWNSTYMMLDRALKYKDALDSYFASIDGSNMYVLDISEWDKVMRVCYLLEPFYEVTNLFSGSDYPTASLYFPYVWKIHTRLNKAATSDDIDIRTAAKEMLGKFDKYWHDYAKVLAFGVIFDPRYKLEFVEYALKNLHGESQGLRKAREVKNKFEELFKEYEVQSGIFNPFQVHDNTRSLNPADDFAEFAAYEEISAATSELDVYLSEKKIALETKLDVLIYWKENSNRFPVLSSMARDILAIPITTVASESTFSMGGRIINKWRSSLSSKSVEALVTCKHWLTGYDDFNVEGNVVLVDSDDETDY